MVVILNAIGHRSRRTVDSRDVGQPPIVAVDTLSVGSHPCCVHRLPRNVNWSFSGKLKLPQDTSLKPELPMGRAH